MASTFDQAVPLQQTQTSQALKPDATTAAHAGVDSNRSNFPYFKRTQQKTCFRKLARDRAGGAVVGVFQVC